MCGISGLLSTSLSPDELRTCLEKMSAALLHRGPDANGHWYDPGLGLGLGHRRLSIIDLSETGRQPMQSRSGRYVIVFNGEVYNFKELREQLQRRGQNFRGGSDTEVILAAIEEWGLVTALQRFNGMFAFAVWDQESRMLHIARDRIGVKPLYYGWVKAGFAFASELKSFEASSEFSSQVDRDILASYMRYGYVPSPFSIYKDIYKLPAGCYFSFKIEELAKRRADFSPDKSDPATPFKPIQYWSAKEVATRGQAYQIKDTKQAIEELDRLLQDAIRLRLVSDVPIGAFLSGGIDSSLVVAIMQRLSEKPINTFSIGFREQELNEAHYAAKIAKHCGASHNELTVAAQDALDVVPHLGTIFDEPFADASQIPTYLLSKLTRKHVTVALSGDGGDELFGGYTRYEWARTILMGLRFIPRPIRQIFSALITAFSQSQWEQVLSSISALLPKATRSPNAGDKLHKLAQTLLYRASLPLHGQMASHWHYPENLVLGARELNFGSFDSANQIANIALVPSLMYFDLTTYLPDDVMVKVDRASMAASIEAREPLLDYRLVEFAWRLPLNLKINNKASKWILRELLSRYVPRQLFERPKMGFSVPLAAWLRGPLRDWAESLLTHENLEGQAGINAKLVLESWHRHLSGNGCQHYKIWNVLMFLSWLKARQNNPN